MTSDLVRDHCLAQEGVTEDLPFGPDVLVLRVGGKMFALLNMNDGSSVNLKCDPERAIDLRERYASITPGYHMNKKHWNTVALDGSLPSSLLRELIDHSYELVRNSLPKKRSRA